MNVTRETVNENLTFGMILVSVILLMFLSNIRAALIVAINIPLALLFAFAVLYLRGKSANLLSIGAVDFGIIVDSSVIMVENIYRYLSGGRTCRLPLRQRIIRAAGEVERSLFFSTLILVCALLPLFTMQGPGRAIVRPDGRHVCLRPGRGVAAERSRSRRCCACCCCKNVKPGRDNLLVRSLKRVRRWIRRTLPAASRGVSGDRRMLIAATIGCAPLSRPGIHARVGGRKSLDSRRFSSQHVAGRNEAKGRRSPGRSCRKYDEVELVVARNRPAGRRHRSERVLSTSNFSCR